MSEEDIADLSRYFRLSIYRDNGDLLLEEYDELNEVLQRCKPAQEIDDALSNYYLGRITEEEYKKIYNKYNDMLRNIFIKKYHLEDEMKLSLIKEERH